MPLVSPFLSARGSVFIQEHVTVDVGAGEPHYVQSMGLRGEKHLSRLRLLHLGVLLSSAARGCLHNTLHVPPTSHLVKPRFSDIWGHPVILPDITLLFLL